MHAEHDEVVREAVEVMRWLEIEQRGIYSNKDTPVGLRRAHNAIKTLVDSLLSASTLAHRPPAGSVVPDGWQLVPVEPTEEMKGAAIAAWQERMKARFGGQEIPRADPQRSMAETYRAMLSAAPSTIPRRAG